jgi:phosphohistidine phosphatase
MELLIVRHAIAMDRVTFAVTEDDDRLRPLTERGRRRMKLGARGLAHWVPRLDLLVSSPLRRARETAEILQQVLSCKAQAVTEVLAPEADPAALLDWLEGREEDLEQVAVVGHEPHLGLLLGWLLVGEQRSVAELRKGSATLVELPEDLASGRARLRWSLTPRQLRAFA